MTSAEVYLEAARLVELDPDQYSCNAIDNADGMPPYQKSPSRSFYENMFSPKTGTGAWLTVSNLGGGYDISHEKKQDIRYTMLALAAAVAEAGDLGDFL
jgi:hypothetical protein